MHPRRQFPGRCNHQEVFLISAINSGLSGLAANTAIVSGAAGNLALLNTTAGADVDPAREMVSLILGQRGFQANIAVIKTAGEMLGSLLDIRV